MDINKKYVSVISKLNRLTQEGKITWRRKDPPEELTKGKDEIVVNFYFAIYEERKICVYEERSKVYGPDIDSFCWDRRIILALFTEEWEKEWEFPQVSGLNELFQSVLYQIAEVSSFIDKVLSNSKEK
jgi:hypothetical protein